MSEVKKGVLSGMTAILTVMLLLPWVPVALRKLLPHVAYGLWELEMPFYFLLWYVINPIFSVFLGLFASKSTKKMLFLPALSAAVFLLGMGLRFTFEEPVFVKYAIGYLLLGALTSVVAARIKK